LTPNEQYIEEVKFEMMKNTCATCVNYIQEKHQKHHCYIDGGWHAGTFKDVKLTDTCDEWITIDFSNNYD
jgi:hypothetical protein